MLRWLTRLFRQRDEAETPATAPPPPAAPSAVAEPGHGARDAHAETSAPLAATGALAEAAAIAEPGLDQPAVVDVPDGAVEDGKETCPTCGRTSVFAGPPGQRFCTYCALRDELFERSAAASE